MKYAQTYTPGQTPVDRGLRWTGRNVEAALATIDNVWISASNTSTTLSIDPDLVLGIVSVPAPPEGYSVLIEGWANFSWDGSSALDAAAKIEVGTAVLCEATLTDNNTAGSAAPYLSTVYTTRFDTNFKLQLDYTTAESSLAFKSRGIKAQYVRAYEQVGD